MKRTFFALFVISALLLFTSCGKTPEISSQNREATNTQTEKAVTTTEAPTQETQEPISKETAVPSPEPSAASEEVSATEEGDPPVEYNDGYSEDSNSYDYESGIMIVQYFDEKTKAMKDLVKPSYEPFGFINETFCNSVKNGFLSIKEDKYPLEDAIKFPEDIPADTNVTYEGMLMSTETEKDANGNRMRLSYIKIGSNKFGHPDNYLVCYVYESMLNDMNDAEKLGSVTNVLVSGSLDGQTVTSNNGWQMAVMTLKSIYKRPFNGFNGETINYPQAVKDNINKKYYVFRTGVTEIFDFDLKHERSFVSDQKYIPQNAHYDSASDSIIINVLNKDTDTIEQQTFSYTKKMEEINNILNSVGKNN